MITVPTVDVGEVREKRAPQCECVKILEDKNEDYIKSNMGLKNDDL